MRTKNPLSSAQQVVRIFKEDNTLLAKLKTEPDTIKVVQEAANTAEAAAEQAVRQWGGDKWLYRIALGTLAILALSTAIGAVILVAIGGKDTPQVLVSLGSAAVGALVGIFAPSPLGRSPASKP
jgi:hypothetical protein